MASFDFREFISMIDSWGISDVIFPFILIFTIIFAILQKSHILGKDKKNFNVVVAMVIAFSTVSFHVIGRYPSNYDPVIVMNKAMPFIALLLVVAIVFFILAGLFGIKPENYKETSYSLITIILLNIFVINAYPEIKDFIFIVSALIAAATIIIGGRMGLGTVPIISAVLVFIIFHWAITGWNTSLPSWLGFLTNSVFQTAAISILVFFVLISMVLREKKKKEK